MQTTAPISAFSDISRFTAMRADARRDGQAAFATVAKEFEALFIQLMLKAARDASVDGGLFNSRELKLYREMLDSQVALAMADQGGLGFEAVLRQQLDIPPGAEPQRELEIPQPVHFPPTLNVAQARPAALDVEPGAGAAEMPHSESGDPAAQPTARIIGGFVDTLRPLAARASAELGVTPDVLIAQAALETGWGRHTIAHADGRSSNNLFAIKAGPGWAGDNVNVKTLEFINGRPIKVNARFRAYPDTAAAFDDYVHFLKGQPRYAAALNHDGDHRRFISELQRAGYATDPRYAQKILAIRDQISAQSTLAVR